MNRIVELLLLEWTQFAEQSKHEDLAYHLVKVLLDLAGCVLAFTGQYVSRYAEGQGPFVSVISSMPELRALLDMNHFEKELKRAIKHKLAPTEELLLERDSTPCVATLSRWAKTLGLWEMQQILGLPGGQFQDLVHGYLTHDSLFGRLKGWAKLYLHPLRPRQKLSPVKLARFLFGTSPHTLTYAAALLAFWAKSGEKMAGWQTRAQHLLPVRVSAKGTDGPVSEIGDMWRWLIRNN